MSNSKRALLIALPAMLLAVAVRVPWSGGPYSRDEAYAVAVGSAIFRGHLSDFPLWHGRYLFYGAASLLPLRPDLQLDLFATLMTAISAAAMAWWTCKLFPWPIAAFASLMYAGASADLATQGQTANTELILNPLLIISLALLTDARRRPGLSRLLLAGLCVGIAGTVKEHVAIFASVMAVALFRGEAGSHERWMRPVTFLAGAAIPWVSTGLVLAALGKFAMVTRALLFSAGYPEVHLKDYVQGPLLLARNAAAFYGTWPFWLLACGLVVARCLGRRVDRLLLAYLASAILLIMAPGFYFAHYYLLALPPVMAAAAGFVEQVALTSRRVAIGLAAFAALHLGVVQVAFMKGNIPLEVRRVAVVNETTSRQRSFSEEIGRRFSGRRILLYGPDNQFFMYSGLRPAQPWFWLDYSDETRFRHPSATAKELLGIALKGLEKRPPDIILLQSPISGANPPPLAAALRQKVSREYRSVDARELAPAAGFSNRDLDLVAIYVRR